MKKLLVMIVLAAVAGSASAATLYNFKGDDSANNMLFSNNLNWSLDTLPTGTDARSSAMGGTSALNPGQLDAEFSDTSFTNAFEGFYLTTGNSYVDVLDGAVLRTATVAIGHGTKPNLHGGLTFKSGSSLQGATASTGKLTIGAVLAVNSSGLLTVEDGVTLSFAELVLNTTGTMAFEFGSDSVSTFTSTKTTGAATMLLNGIVEVDLLALDTMDTYTLFDTGSDASTVLSGLLITDLAAAGGAITNSLTSTHFSVSNAGERDWSLELSGNDLVLTVIPEPATLGMLGLGALITLFIRRMRI